MEVKNGSVTPKVISAFPSGSGASSHSRMVSWKTNATTKPTPMAPSEMIRRVAELVEVLDERDAIAVLEATRQAGHGALAGDALGLDALGLGRRRGWGSCALGRRRRRQLGLLGLSGLRCP